MEILTHNNSLGNNEINRTERPSEASDEGTGNQENVSPRDEQAIHEKSTALERPPLIPLPIAEPLYDAPLTEKMYEEPVAAKEPTPRKRVAGRKRANVVVTTATVSTKLATPPALRKDLAPEIVEAQEKAVQIAIEKQRLAEEGWATRLEHDRLRLEEALAAGPITRSKTNVLKVDAPAIVSKKPLTVPKSPALAFKSRKLEPIKSSEEVEIERLEKERASNRKMRQENAEAYKALLEAPSAPAPLPPKLPTIPAVIKLATAARSRSNATGCSQPWKSDAKELVAVEACSKAHASNKENPHASVQTHPKSPTFQTKQRTRPQRFKPIEEEQFEAAMAARAQLRNKKKRLPPLSEPPTLQMPESKSTEYESKKRQKPAMTLQDNGPEQQQRQLAKSSAFATEVGPIITRQQARQRRRTLQGRALRVRIPENTSGEDHTY